MKLVEGYFAEGEKVQVIVDGKLITRVVHYDREVGLYITYKGKKYSEDELQ
jgi:hypothetical protein